MKKILREEDIIKIIEKRLPEIIEKSPFFRLKIEEIMDKRAVTREEIKEILKELKAQREELRAQREELKAQREELKAQRKEIADGFRVLRDAITALGARWGIFAEEAFRESMEDILKELGFYDVKK
ncbi:MAG: DUF3782 domain-containing protein [candidate division WOR-3 bacterium]